MGTGWTPVTWKDRAAFMVSMYRHSGLGLVNNRHLFSIYLQWSVIVLLKARCFADPISDRCGAAPSSQKYSSTTLDCVYLYLIGGQLDVKTKLTGKEDLTRRK